MENERIHVQLRRETKEKAESMLEEIKESKYGRLKLEAISAIPLVIGSIFGGIGRATGTHFLPAVPIAMDFMTTGTGCTTPRGLGTLAMYSMGVALPYADVVYSALQTRIPELVQIVVDKI